MAGCTVAALMERVHGARGARNLHFHPQVVFYTRAAGGAAAFRNYIHRWQSVCSLHTLCSENCRNPTLVLSRVRIFAICLAFIFFNTIAELTFPRVPRVGFSLSLPFAPTQSFRNLYRFFSLIFPGAKIFSSSAP